MRDFKEWLGSFREIIADYMYYVDFDKAFRNTDAVKVRLNILNSLVGSKNIEADFESLIAEYPEVLRCIPILLAKRESEISVTDLEGTHIYDFSKMSLSVNQYKHFMRESGLFDLISNHIIGNLVDYVLGVEAGLSSHGRKNRGGDLMEDLIEGYIRKAGFMRDVTYFKEMKTSQIESKWGIDLSCITNKGTTEKKFDFVVKGNECIYGIETNFYTTGGSKPNEVARSYKTIALETKGLDYFKFVWFTDGKGWNSAKDNLLETFDVLDNLYNICDLENGIMTKIFK